MLFTFAVGTSGKSFYNTKNSLWSGSVMKLNLHHTVISDFPGKNNIIIAYICNGNVYAHTCVRVMYCSV